jgi:cytochrome c oxidase subunit 2
VSAPDYGVIHSWWIPALGGKFDAIPGRVNETWFSAEAPGIYRGQCAELCGGLHALMTAEVEAMPPRQFDAWLAREARAQEAGTSDLGAETFRGACGKCHGLAGEGDVGPPLAGNPLLDDPEAVEQVIRNGRNEMPPVGKSWDERQMKALTDYLQKELLGG